MKVCSVPFVWIDVRTTLVKDLDCPTPVQMSRLGANSHTTISTTIGQPYCTSSSNQIREKHICCAYIYISTYIFNMYDMHALLSWGGEFADYPFLNEITLTMHFS